MKIQRFWDGENSLEAIFNKICTHSSIELKQASEIAALIHKNFIVCTYQFVVGNLI